MTHCASLRVSTALLLLAGLCSVAAADPLEWPVALGGNGHYYEAIAAPEGYTWVEALAAAESSYWLGQQGYLATITSAEENAWIWASLGEPHQHRIGAIQPPGSPEPSGGWSWLTGEPWSYANWRPNEPNNGGDLHDESTIEMHELGEWNDIHQIIPRPGYIVEFDEGASPVREITWGSIKALFELAE